MRSEVRHGAIADRHLALVALLALLPGWFALGLEEGLRDLGLPVPGGAALAIVGGIAGVALCHFDGRARRRYPAPIAFLPIFWAGPFALPVYALWSRGWRGLLLALGLGALLVAASGAGFALALLRYGGA